MSHDRDQLLLSEFNKSLKKNDSALYSNLDDNFSEKFDFFIKPYEDILKVTGTHITPNKWSYNRIGIITGGEVQYTCGIYRFTAKKIRWWLFLKELLLQVTGCPKRLALTFCFQEIF